MLIRSQILRETAILTECQVNLVQLFILVVDRNHSLSFEGVQVLLEYIKGVGTHRFGLELIETIFCLEKCLSEFLNLVVQYLQGTRYYKWCIMIIVSILPFFHIMGAWTRYLILYKDRARVSKADRFAEIFFRQRPREILVLILVSIELLLTL